MPATSTYPQRKRSDPFAAIRSAGTRRSRTPVPTTRRECGPAGYRTDAAERWGLLLGTGGVGRRQAAGAGPCLPTEGPWVDRDSGYVTEQVADVRLGG